MLRAALFDMDGVIYDSMRYHAIAWNRTMTACGIPMSEEDCYAHEGMRGLETIKKLHGKDASFVLLMRRLLPSTRRNVNALLVFRNQR